MKRKAVVVVGPTASGKTALGVHICKLFNGEVISGDSMQIYKGLEISTAKPTLSEMDGIKHHLIDFLDVTEKYSVSDFCKDAGNAFDDIISQEKLPVIVGGTGLYIDSFVTNTSFLEEAKSDDIKIQLKNELEEFGIEYMYDQLKSVDPVAAEKIHPNNTVRVLRALEVFRTTGITITEQAEKSHETDSDIDPLFIGITYADREKLYERINKRVDLMIEKGLLNEAENFFESTPSKTAFNSIGCKELKPYFDAEKSLYDCIEDLKRSTRRYAKRQLTWFKRNEKIHWFYPDLTEQEELLDSVNCLINDFLVGETT